MQRSGTSSFEQNILISKYNKISLRYFSSYEVDRAIKYIHSCKPDALGVSVTLSHRGTVESVALASSREVICCGTGPMGSGAHPLQSVLDGSVVLAGFHMSRLALHLHRDLRTHVRGVDLSTLWARTTMEPDLPSRVAHLRLGFCERTADTLWESDEGSNLYLRAWLAACIAEASMPDLNQAKKVYTRRLSQQELAVLADAAQQIDLLEMQKPRSFKNDFSAVAPDKDGYALQNERYKTRVRASNQTRVIVTTEHGDFNARAARTEGKKTLLKGLNGVLRGEVVNVRVEGHQEPTVAERARDEFILFSLQGLREPKASPFVRLFWFHDASVRRLARFETQVTYTENSLESLNPSQKEVVYAMLDENQPLVVVHGGPGTGKTTTIAHAVTEWVARDETLWIVAPSNVATKNIALSLFKHNIPFRLIVSKEFHLEWHEHIYNDIEKRVLRMDRIPDHDPDRARMFIGIDVVLCTVSMLSNPGLDTKGIFDLVPLSTLVVDEASQISVYDFIHLFDKFNRVSKLKKVCMFGDPMQLPPYGAESISTMKSVFDITNFREPYFLSVQYRMPMPVGDFISQAVYGGRLRSEHQVVGIDCVKFVDVSTSSEIKSGFSWENPEEAEIISHLISAYYRNRNFAIVTPYDSQRSRIERLLRQRDLPWEHVFNVDSFQGHEADCILISLVRTTIPGFLSIQNRVNVMLTRCKVSMVIVTQQAFMRTPAARNTLFGRLCQHWELIAGAANTWINSRRIISGSAQMPGVNGLPGVGYAQRFLLDRIDPFSINYDYLDDDGKTTRKSYIAHSAASIAKPPSNDPVGAWAQLLRSVPSTTRTDEPKPATASVKSPPAMLTDAVPASFPSHPSLPSIQPNVSNHGSTTALSSFGPARPKTSMPVAFQKALASLATDEAFPPLCDTSTSGPLLQGAWARGSGMLSPTMTLDSAPPDTPITPFDMATEDDMVELDIQNMTDGLALATLLGTPLEKKGPKWPVKSSKGKKPAIPSLKLRTVKETVPEGAVIISKGGDEDIFVLNKKKIRRI